MLRRIHIIAFVLALLTASVHAAMRDGSTVDKAVPLKNRGLDAVEEQMQWMLRSHRYTPMLAMRDVLQESAADAVRRLKAGKQPSDKTPPQPWQHETLEHNGHYISYWWFRTPRGRREMYFDTGVPISMRGELTRQEASVVKYYKRYVESLKISI